MDAALAPTAGLAPADVRALGPALPGQRPHACYQLWRLPRSRASVRPSDPVGCPPAAPRVCSPGRGVPESDEFRSYAVKLSWHGAPGGGSPTHTADPVPVPGLGSGWRGEGLQRGEAG